MFDSLKKKDHLFGSDEIYKIHRAFLNLQKYTTEKFNFHSISNFEDIYTKFPYGKMQYIFDFNKKRVEFYCQKSVLKNFDVYTDYYETNTGSKTGYGKGYFGLPSLSEMKQSPVLFPFKVLEMYSIVWFEKKKIKKKFVETEEYSDKYYLWIMRKIRGGRIKGSWEDELIKNFNTSASKLIKETLKIKTNWKHTRDCL